jgi:serine/threonine protein kinase
VLHQVGVGALGPVFRTYEPTRDRLVAVKVFRLDATPEQAQALADELARSADAGLFHPSIVEPIAAGVQGTVAYRAEEYVAAESLDVAMRHYAPASIDKVLPFITQLAGAIDFARAAGVGHGALHPRDIFVTPEEARASGFGVVDALERTGLRAPVRRPYSAPERIAGVTWGTPADVFSLAAVAFEMLTGRRPSGTGAQIGAFGEVGATHAEAIRGVLARAMDEDPERRYPSALGFAAALEAAALGESVSGVVTEVGAVGAAAAPPPAPPPPIIDTPITQVAPPEPPKAVVPPAVMASEPPAHEAVEPSPPKVIEPVLAKREEVDDVAAERDEDEAFFELTRREAATQPPIEERILFKDEPARIAADSLALDAAELALRPDVDAPEPKRDVGRRREPPPPSPRVPESKRDKAAAGGVLGLAEPVRPTPRTTAEPPPPRTSDFRLDESRGDRALFDSPPPERSRVAILPTAVMFLAGLAIGFGAGHVVGGRSAAKNTSATNTAAPASGTQPQGTPSAAQPGSKEFSEQSVTPAPATGQAGQTSPAPTPSAQHTPSAAPPDVPRESPDAGRSSAPPALEKKPGAAARGRIAVQSTPSRAAVTLNGKWRGRTPITLDNLGFGSYAVRVVQPGYQVFRQQVRLSADDPEKSLNVELEKQPTPAQKAAPPRKSAASSKPAASPKPGAAAQEGKPYTGAVFVDSRPQGARIFIDGKELGTTPARIPEIGIGSHVIRLELANHRNWTTSVRVVAGEEARVTGSLEPIR